LVFLVAGCFVVGGLATWKFLEVINEKPEAVSSQSEVEEAVNNQQKEESAAAVEEDQNPENKPVESGGEEAVDGGKKQVTVFITDATQYEDDGGILEVRAFVGEISENDGVCVVSLRKGALEVRRTAGGIGGGTKTDCTTVDIPIGEFKEDGEWKLVVSYSSGKSVGEVEKDVIIRR
jgi:hypothetical protein